ncbi:hypothetical protein KUCAC02_020118 [Chaenocephalus aceratus]|uniref:Uncharacterized protein n=1 Tax=Chaenocephalus aceratus TaxID=36190 RepID=A0ACB9VRG8_CHAAC|nr:hypothetical protein KUCAC02_020118 [Chaenocephalus aceratus]
MKRSWWSGIGGYVKLAGGEPRWSPGGAQVEPRWSPGGAQVEPRWSPGGAQMGPFPEPASQPALHRGLWWQRGYGYCPRQESGPILIAVPPHNRSIGTVSFRKYRWAFDSTSCALG